MEIYFIKELISMVFNFIKTNFFFLQKVILVSMIHYKFVIVD